jgi:hypothetical protein
MSNTGFKAYTNLEQYYLDNGVATGVTKTNSISDPDYIAPTLDLTFCPLPSASPSATPSISVTPTMTPTPTPTPTSTPTNTPSISISPSIPSTPSYTPTNTPTPTLTPTSTPPPTVTPSVTPSISGGFAPQVINAQGYTQPCTGGSCNDYLGWYITLNQPVVVDTNYTLNIDLYQYGFYQYTYTAYGTILAGTSNHNSDPCSGGGAYIGCDYSVNNVCVATIDSPVIPSTYGC